MTMFLKFFLYSYRGDYMRKIILIFAMMSLIMVMLLGNRADDSVAVHNEEEIRSVFISYIEISNYFNNVSYEVADREVSKIIDNVESFGFNEVIIQVRSFMDSIYQSDIFPWSRYLTGEEGKSPGYDLLKLFLDKAKEKGLRVVAWINPYRVRNDENLANLSLNNPVYKYIGSDVLYINNGVYLNPSKEETVEIIVDGVMELVKNYKIEGVLFDDYFYPDNEIDKLDYNEYVKKYGYIEKQKYNLDVVNNMIKKVYDICHKYNVEFGVSPDGNMENNYNKVYADVKKWCSEEGYIDFIMPQIYYGFYNETKPFAKVLEEWESIVTNENVDFRVALAFYKVGSHDKWAKSGENEWIEASDIIMRQIVLARNTSNYKGFALYRYEYLFETDNFTDTTLIEKENIKKVLN